MKTYTKYKPSNIEWIGDIPEHWGIRRLKNIADFINRGTAPDYVEESDFGVINQATFSKGFFDLSNLRYTIKSNSESTRGILKHNDILLASTGGGILGKTIIFNLEGNYIGDSHISIIRDTQNRIDACYYFYFLKINYDLINGVLAEGSTNQTELRREWLKDFRVMFPPLPEQTAIANFLDQKTSQIDTAIAKKQRLIELLEIERMAIINTVIEKSSEWNEVRLKYIAKIQPSNVDKKSFEDEVTIFLCNYLDVYKNEFIDSSVAFMEATALEREIEKFKLKKGDILVTKDSESPDDIAIPALVVEDFDDVICGYHLAQIRPNNNIILSEFLFRYFQCVSVRNYFELESNGVTRFALGVDSFSNLKVCFPSLQKQLEIVENINIQNTRIDATVFKIQNEIELLKEYRQSLIFEAVTGKIKVIDLN